MLKLEYSGPNNAISKWQIVKAAPGSIPSGQAFVEVVDLPVTMEVFSQNYTKFRVDVGVVTQISSTTLNGRVLTSIGSTPLTLKRANTVELMNRL